MRVRITWVVFACVLASVIVPAGPALAAPLLRGLGGPAGFGPGNLPANDDGSSAEIDVRAAFPDGLRFFGMTFTSLYVNNNGNVSFGGSNGTYTPEAFPVASLRMIAPWWGDVDTRGGGVPARNGVYWSITPGRFVATWHNVGYFSTHDDLQNDFQLILQSAGPGVGDFDVEFRYSRCEWTTGDASGGSNGFGGTPAQAGFDAGNLMDYVSLPGSRTMRVLDLCTTSNVGMSGVWRFTIRGGEVMCAGLGDPCDTGEPGICSDGTIRCRGEDSLCVANEERRMEACNGLDDDCNGSTDEGLGASTCGVGACVVTVQNCVGGSPQMCVPGRPRAEACNLVDDDCNGTVDDMPDTTCGVGECRSRVTTCIGGMMQACVPGTPAPELCNGRDDDCNGLIDDTLIDCVPPDAGPPDAGPEDAGVSSNDASVMRRDAGNCWGWACDPNRLQGRAGPIGNCRCRAGIARWDGESGAWLGLIALAIVLRARRRYAR